jgi:GTPase SAR1 family protein
MSMYFVPQFYLFRIALLGEQKVGKTSIRQRFVDDTFAEEYKSTIGAEFSTQRVEVNGRVAILHLVSIPCFYHRHRPLFCRVAFGPSELIQIRRGV